MFRFKGHIHRLAYLAAVLLSLTCFVASALAAQVAVRGNHRVDAETIRSYFAGTSADDVNKGVKDLYATGLFSSVKVSRGGGGVVITVDENRSINRVVFEGNSKVKSEQLAGEITSKTRGPYSPTIVNADIERIKDIYRRSGRAAASVRARTVELSNGKLDVVFTVDEGDKTGVKEINFVGNKAYSGGKLRDLMETTEMNFLSFFKSSDVYDPTRIGSDLELIRRFYLKNGYADFRVIGSDAQYVPAKRGYVITITVEEGPQYKVGSVSVDSHLPALSNASLQPKIRLHVGDTYNGDLVEKTVEAMTREVNRRGYAFSTVKPRGDRDPVSRRVSIVFTVEDGPRVYIERIVITGNTRTRDYVIRREFEIGEGDAYNKVLIDKAERRLNGLGFFKKVTITNQAGSAPDRVVILVNVEDTPTGSLSLSGGYSTVDGIIGEVAVTETNFLGRGQYVRTALTAGQRTRGIEFNFTEPYFLGQRLAAGFDLFAKQTDVSQYSFYNNFIAGGTLRLGLPLTDELTFSPRYSLFRSVISVPNTTQYPYNDCSSPIFGVTPSPGTSKFSGGGNPYAFGTFPASPYYNCLTNGEASLALKQAQGTTITSLFGYTLSYNSLDSGKSPTEGFLAELRQDLAGAGGTEHYLRTTGDVRYYRPIYDQIIGLVHLQAGDLRTLGNDQLRIVDNFNLGPTLVRGFAPDGIGPRDVSYGIDYAGNPLGGTEYWGASVESQFPLYGVPRDLGLKGAVFFDAGSVFGFHGQTNFTYGGPVIPYNTAPNYTQGNTITVGGNSTMIRSAAGVSLIWASPLGPIRFDFAKAITKNQYDQTQIFRFSGGATF